VVGETDGLSWFEKIDGSYDIQRYIYYESGMDYIYLNDLDSDGDFDVLGFNEHDDELVWFENLDGVGNFGPKTIISTTCNNPTMAAVADIDQDGDLDIVLTSSDDNKVAWYANLDGQGSFGSEQVISSTVGSANDIKTSDID